jgi:PAS domain-containing protein
MIPLVSENSPSPLRDAPELTTATPNDGERSTPGMPTDPAALLAAIVQSSHDAIVGKSLDGVVLTWNAAAEEIFGWRAHEIIGRSIRALIPESRQAEEDVILASIRAGERVPTFETVRARSPATSPMPDSCRLRLTRARPASG